MTTGPLGDQLSLFEGGLIFPGTPWDGRSPRALTRAWCGFIFKPRGAKSVSDFTIDLAQVDMFPEDFESPRVYSGAPSLLPLPEVNHG